MGFGLNGKKTLYRLTGLTRVDVATIAKERAKESNQDRRAVIDFDCNNVVYFVINNAMGVVEETVAGASYGVIAVPVCDGDTRHTTNHQNCISQKPSNNIREKNRISAIVDCQKLNEATS
eukprot:scaffold107879_cov23-Cyclotella_meneghiniana.AAC.3